MALDCPALSLISDGSEVLPDQPKGGRIAPSIWPNYSDRVAELLRNPGRVAPKNAGDAENTEKNKDIYWEKPRQKQTKFFTAGDAEGGAAERIKKLFYGKIHFQDIFTAESAEGHREEQKPFYGKIHFQDICIAESAEGHRRSTPTAGRGRKANFS